MGLSIILLLKWYFQRGDGPSKIDKKIDLGDRKGEFKIIKFIGKGGYGKVHKVMCKSDRKIYAIKTIQHGSLNFGKYSIIIYNVYQYHNSYLFKKI